MDVAERASRPFIPIYLLCDLSENLERVVNPERVKSGTKKPTDIEFLKVLRGRCELVRFNEGSQFDARFDKHAAARGCRENTSVRQRHYRQSYIIGILSSYLLCIQ